MGEGLFLGPEGRVRVPPQPSCLPEAGINSLERKPMIQNLQLSVEPLMPDIQGSTKATRKIKEHKCTHGRSRYCKDQKRKVK